MQTAAPATAALVTLTVRYKSEAAAVQPQQTFTHGQLVAATNGDGEPVAIPGRSLPEKRLALTAAGYRPDYPAWRWLDTGKPPRRRTEIWRLVDAPDTMISADMPDLRVTDQGRREAEGRRRAMRARRLARYEEADDSTQPWVPPWERKRPGWSPGRMYRLSTGLQG